MNLQNYQTITIFIIIWSERSINISIKSKFSIVFFFFMHKFVEEMKRKNWDNLRLDLWQCAYVLRCNWRYIIQYKKVEDFCFVHTHTHETKTVFPFGAVCFHCWSIENVSFGVIFLVLLLLLALEEQSTNIPTCLFFL